MTNKQAAHNKELDILIKQSNEEHEKYIAELNDQRDYFERRNPDFPKEKLKYMFLPVIERKIIIGTKYID